MYRLTILRVIHNLTWFKWLTVSQLWCTIMKVRFVGDRYGFYTFCGVQALISFDSGHIFEDACRITRCKTEAGNSSEQRADYLLATIEQDNPWKGQIRFYAAYYKDQGVSKLGIPWRPCKCAALRLPRAVCIYLRSKQCKFAGVHEAVAGSLLTLLRPLRLLTRFSETVCNRNVK